MYRTSFLLVCETLLLAVRQHLLLHLLDQILRGFGARGDASLLIGRLLQPKTQANDQIEGLLTGIQSRLQLCSRGSQLGDAVVEVLAKGRLDVLAPWHEAGRKVCSGERN